MFFNNQKSKDKEARLLRRFLGCLDEMDSYLDKYDEFYGLAFNKDDPQKCVEKLWRFLGDRLGELVDDEKE
jgi:hypothetical protein